MKVKLLTEDAIAPTRGTEYSAGYDFYANEQCIIEAGDQKLISTGVSIEIPTGYYGKIFDRSGFTLNYHTRIAAGVIDSDYRGEVKILIQNLGKNPLNIAKDSRIAQMIIMPCLCEDIEVVDILGETVRDAGGFGSTGLH